MIWTAREQAAHLLRRFGLGASAEEVARFEKLGVNKTIEALIDYPDTPSEPEVSPWEFVFQDKQQIQLDPGRITRWWALLMLTSTRPSREKLALFWHDHFAVSGAKVESGPMMLGYLQNIQANARGSFSKLLLSMGKDPAMLRWLDTDTSIKGQPNENFAREVMELFTMGIGHYTEKDVQEAARAFTGWSIRTLYRGGKPIDQMSQIRESIAYHRPLYASTYAEGLHDDGQKTILGKTAPFDMESFLEYLAYRPETAHYICGKLWSYYAYPNPEPKIVDRLAKVYLDSKTDIRSVLFAIASSKEFWSEKAYRGQVKSPVDFVIAIVRQLGLRDKILASRDPKAAPTTPIPPDIVALTETVAGAMRKQGMTLLYPPDVAGWDWGTAWVSPAMMLERMRFASLIFGRGRSQTVVEALTKEAGGVGAPDDKFVDGILSVFDAQMTPEQRQVMIQAFQKAGGSATMAKPQSAAGVLGVLAKLMFAMPEYQFC